MKQELHDYIQAEKDNIDEGDTTGLEAIMATFNSWLSILFGMGRAKVGR